MSKEYEKNLLNEFSNNAIIFSKNYTWEDYVIELDLLIEKFINNIYNNNNLNLWWNSDNLQNVRKLFCEKYCRHSKNPINDFKKSLIFNE